MPKTLQDQVAELIELLILSGWTMTIYPPNFNNPKPFSVEGKHPRHAIVTANNGETLIDALAPFEDELPLLSRESMRYARREADASLARPVDLLGECTEGHPWSPLIGSCIGVGCGAVQANAELPRIGSIVEVTKIGAERHGCTAGERAVIERSVETGHIYQPGVSHLELFVRLHSGGTFKTPWPTDSIEMKFEPDEFAHVWTVGGPDQARFFFGASPDAEVVCLKPSPQTERERAKYKPEAKLYGVRLSDRKVRDEQHTTAGALKRK